jgi:peptide/nickel transport system substrate-binding protein
MFGGPATATEAVWPQPHPYSTNIEAAKKLMAESTHPQGFDTVFSFDMGFADVNEPMAVLIQESLGQIGIRTTINKVPGANFRTELNKKTMPIYLNVFSGWLDYPEYFFFWCYDGQNSIFNTMSYVSPEMDKLIDGARDSAAIGATADYTKDVVGFVNLAFKDMPRVPLYQPYVNVAMQPNVSGYQYWFHRRLDYRNLVKA